MAKEIGKLQVELLDPELVALADKIVSVIDPNLQTNGICQTSDELTWSHYCRLISVESKRKKTGTSPMAVEIDFETERRMKDAQFNPFVQIKHKNNDKNFKSTK